MTTTAIGAAARLVDERRASVVRRPVAGDGWRWLRRLPGGAAGVGADVAGGGAPGGADGDTPEAGDRAGSPRLRRSGRRACLEGSRTRRTPGSRSSMRRRSPKPPRSRCWRGSGGSCCRGSFARRRIAGGGRRTCRHAAALPCSRPAARPSLPRCRSPELARDRSPDQSAIRPDRQPRNSRRGAAGRGARRRGRRGSTLVGVAVADGVGEVLASAWRPRSGVRGSEGRCSGRSSTVVRPRGRCRPRSGSPSGTGLSQWTSMRVVMSPGKLLTGAGFELGRVSPDVSRDDPWAISGRRSA